MAYLKAGMFVACLLGVYLIVPVYLTSQLTPDDEDSNYLTEFLSLLEDKTGLSNLTPNLTIKGITNCDDVTECTVNPNGTVIWDIRYTLYEKNMIQGATDQHISIDGCLNDTYTDIGNNKTYNACMANVRTNMITFLTKEFEDLFLSKINSDCTLIPDNCV